MGRTNIILLSTADMDSAVWTNKQHLAHRLAQRHPVTYINSMGLRAPRLGRSDLLRIAKRLKSARRSSVSVGAPKVERAPIGGLAVVNPHVVPFHGLSLIRRVNRLLIARQLRKVLSHLQGPVVLWSFSPITYGIEDHCDGVIYHSVDLLHELPHVPRQALLKAEESLIAKADGLVASSSEVAAHLRGLGGLDVRLFRNVADTLLYQTALRNRGTASRTHDVVFAGNITPSKINIDILQKIVDAGVRVALAGPMEIDGTSDRRLSRLVERSNVTYLGNLGRQELANLLTDSRVGIIPYEINSYTTGVFPMKVFEYLSAGCDVVSTDLPSLAAESIRNVTVARDVESFADAVQNAARNFRESDGQMRAETAFPNSWENRLTEAEHLISEILKA